MRRRTRGIALVELLVALTLISVIMSAVAICLQSMYRADRRTREFTAGRSALSRLFQQFRADAHVAVDATVKDQAAEEPPSIVFSRSAGETVEYRFEQTHVLRVVRKDEKDAHRDAFRLARRTRVKWQTAAGNDPFATMIVHYMPVSDVDEATRQQRIEAAVGLHYAENQNNE